MKRRNVLHNTEMERPKNAPSEVHYKELQYAYRRINSRLFGGTLPNCLLTLQRRPNTRGYTSPGKFESRRSKNKILDEIAINPAAMPDMTDANILATLAFNMCRIWQFHFGHASRPGYINRELATKMMSIGMMPSSTGKEGGKQVGQHTDGYVQPGGPLDELIQHILNTGWRFEYQDRFVDKEDEEEKKPKPNRKKYVCWQCGLAAWAKPEAFLICGDCDFPMEEV